MSIEVGNALWCRDLIDELKDGGVWGIPRSGVIFRKTGPNRLTWVGTMPAREKRGENHREGEYLSNCQQFGAAGITIDREETLMEFDNIDAARDYYCIGGETLIGDSFSQSRLNPGLDYRQGETGMRELERLNKMLPDSVSQSRLNPRDHYDNIRTQRPTGNDHSIAKMLLRGTKVSPDAFKNHAGPLAPPLEIDDRPLIDKLHEATFTDTIGMQWFKDKYALRMLLRKAHCFTLDKTTSALIADFSIAIAPDLESARRLAIPPFPVTWIEIDNVARLNRIKEMGIPLTKTAAGETEAGAPVPRVGWLITPGAESGYNATYVVQLDSGMASAPLSYWWHSEEPSARPEQDAEDRLISELCFGVKECNVGTTDALPVATPLHGFDIKHGTSLNVLEMMGELAGELRHIWGLLVALGAGQLGIEASHTPQAKPQTMRKMPNGKPLLPLEHKLLHLHLAKRATVDKVVARAISHHKNREHEVRAHFRTYRNKEDGSVRMRIPIESHKRGDIRLGKIEKTYRVER